MFHDFVNKRVDTFPKFLIAVVLVCISYMLPPRFAFAELKGFNPERDRERLRHARNEPREKRLARYEKQRQKNYKAYKKLTPKRSTLKELIASYRGEKKGTGVASWFGPVFNSKRTASDRLFIPGELTAAHRTFPIGTVLKITNVNNGSSVMVVVAERGPLISGRILDISMAAFERISYKGAGLAKIEYEVIQLGNGIYRPQSVKIIK